MGNQHACGSATSGTPRFRGPAESQPARIRRLCTTRPRRCRRSWRSRACHRQGTTRRRARCGRARPRGWTRTPTAPRPAPKSCEEERPRHVRRSGRSWSGDAHTLRGMLPGGGRSSRPRHGAAHAQGRIRASGWADLTALSPPHEASRFPDADHATHHTWTARARSQGRRSSARRACRGRWRARARAASRRACIREPARSAPGEHAHPVRVALQLGHELQRWHRHTVRSRCGLENFGSWILTTNNQPALEHSHVRPLGARTGPGAVDV